MLLRSALGLLAFASISCGNGGTGAATSDAATASDSSGATDATNATDATATTAPSDASTDADATDAATATGAPDSTSTTTPASDAGASPYEAGYACDALPPGSTDGCAAIYDRFCDDGGGAGPGYHEPCSDAAFGSGVYPLYCTVNLPSTDPGTGGQASCVCQPGSPPAWTCGI
jgi:hypothetical protein